MFNNAETVACERLVRIGLEEDLGPPSASVGDVTSESVLPPDIEGKAVFVARAAGVVAGLPAAMLVFATERTPGGAVELLMYDGDRIEKGDRLAVVSGLMGHILAGERTALNFLTHLSGVATLTRRFVDAVAGLPCKILDTRKTLPGYRLLQKYAVRCGGGHNHRMGLYDALLIKDNHLAAMDGLPESFAKPIRESINVPLIVEVDRMEQLKLVLAWNPDVVLLDNMGLSEMRQVVGWRNDNAPKLQLEASGGVTFETVRAIAETGVDRISIGALTHSAPALDIAFDYESP